MTHVFSRRASRVTAVAVLAAVGVLGLPVVPAAVADDATAAWSVSPADAAGTADSRTRLELQADPGASVQDHLVISNASTVETFRDPDLVDEQLRRLVRMYVDDPRCHADNHVVGHGDREEVRWL